MTIFATLTPIDLGTNTRVTVRVCASADQQSTGAAGERWWPALVTMPVIQRRFFDGDFSSSVEPATGSMDIRLDVLISGGAFPGVERYDWAGASCRLQRLSGGSLVEVEMMQVESFAQEAMQLGLRLRAAGDLFDADVLRARYAGTTGAEGGADLKGQLKPWVFGRAANIEPVPINQIDSVFQVSGYGPVQAISAVYERGASFGASIGDFANYAALVAATIPPGRWATCLAQGMFRLGAPPAGVITCDVDGDNAGGFLRRTGAILTEIANRIGLVDKVNLVSMSALDAAVARNVNIVIREQASFMELAQRMLAPCNAVASVGSAGRLIASRAVFGSEQFTLDAQGREMPPVINMARQNTSAPYKRVQLGAARSWRVHSFDEIAFYSELIDRGLYDAATTYREGNIVETANKARWVYVNPTPSSGNAPPAWPTSSNSFWSNIAPPIGGDLIGSIVAPANANRVPFSKMEGDRGWETFFNPSGLSIASGYNTIGGRRYYDANATTTAAGQSFALRSQFFGVSSSERLSAQARFLIGGVASGTWIAQLVAFDAANNPSFHFIAGGTGEFISTDNVRAEFAQLPAGAVTAYIQLLGTSAGAGTMQILISEPMVTSAAPGQTVHPPFSPGPNAFDGATVGAPAGTLVAGVESSALVGQAAQASSDALAAGAAAFAANLAIANITADNILSRDEKPEIRKQRDAIIAEYPVIRARAVALSVAVSGYDADYTALIAYLGGLDLGGATDTAITRATFNTFFTDYYAERQTVLDGIAFEAARRATWATISGPGKPEDNADVTALAQRSIEPQFPNIIINQGEPGSSGNRLILHAAKRGTSNLAGGTWSLPARSLGAGTASINASTGTVTLSGIVQSGTYTIRYTHTDGIATDLVVNVTFIASAPVGTASDGPVGLSNTDSSSFVPITFRDLTVTLPAGVTSVTVSAVAVDLFVEAASPVGTFNVEFRVMRETSPGTWAAVGSVATSDPSPEAFVAGVDPDFNEFFGSEPGAITISRTATGLSAGSTQKFRIEARRASGSTKEIFISGTASATT